MKDIEDRKDIEALVNTFYDTVFEDETIGYFFNDVVDLDRNKHLTIMYDFWESILLSGRTYKGNPMIKHFAIHKKELLLAHHFKAWILLWKNTVNSLYKGDKATEAITKASSIALLMEYKMNNHY